MKKLLTIVAMTGFIFLFVSTLALGEKENLPTFNKEDLIENLIESPSLEDSEDFKTLFYLNDEFLIEMKVDLTHYRKSVLTQTAEVIEKYLPENPPQNKKEEVKKILKTVQRCSDIENNIWLIIKVRQLYDQRLKEDRLVEAPRSMQ